MCHYFLAAILFMSTVSLAFSAVPVQLRQLSPVLGVTTAVEMDKTKLVQTHSEVDFNHTQHIRFQQQYEGYMVWGTQSVVHIPQSGSGQYRLSSVAQLRQDHLKGDGVIYQNIVPDLASTPTFALSVAQSKKAKERAIQLAHKKFGDFERIAREHVQRIVYVDKKNNKAHWAYYISFMARKTNGEPIKPNAILDASTLNEYQAWNDLQTLEQVTNGGGFGGNKKSGKTLYDGTSTHRPILLMTRNDVTKICALKNNDVTVTNAKQEDVEMTFSCDEPNKLHQNLFWDGEQDQVNGAYSPANDALFIGDIVKRMYQEWYNIPVLVKKDKPMMLIMRVHERIENAYWDGETMTFGDGGKIFYPLVSLGVGAHEISHGFTEQHSGLLYYGEAGAINESFSDMASQAAEFYAFKKSSWQIGAEISKEDNTSLRYLDEPTKDCTDDKKPGHKCSVSQVKDYSPKLDVHFGSGIFNKLFYLISTTEGWDTQKAFNVMVQANRYYWTPVTTFSQAACGILTATQDFNYDPAPVRRALDVVGVNSSKC